MFIKFANIRPDQLDEYQYCIPIHLIYQTNIQSLVSKTYDLAGSIRQLQDSGKK